MSYEALHVFRLALTCCVFLLTMIGNSIAIYFIYKNPELRSLKNYYYGYYLINLNIADLLVAIFCIPFTVVYYETTEWTFGVAFCKIMPTLQVMSVSASITTLCVITFERYRAIIHPMKPRSSFTRLKIKIILIWMWAMTVSAPSGFAYNLDATRPTYQCSEQWPTTDHRKIYTLALFLLNYAFPLLFSLINYLLIVSKLKSSGGAYEPDTSRILHNRFFKLMVLLLTSFAICYLPGYICFFLLDFGSSVAENPSFITFITFSHLLTWINSCLNPYFYCALHGYFKRKRQRNCKVAQQTSACSSLISADSFRRYNPREIDTVHNERHFDPDQGLNSVDYVYKEITETFV